MARPPAASEADLRGDVRLAPEVVVHDRGVLEAAAEVLVT
jgi:hypothetical protein